MLKDPILQRQLVQKGFVKFPFLDRGTITRLIDLYGKYEDAHVFNGKHHHSTFHIGKREIAETVDNDIRTIIEGDISNFFSDYDLFVANFMIKEPGDASEVVPHQDWTYVDEPRYFSLNIWVPLQDVDEHNGCLTFLPASHSISTTLRTSPYYPNLFDNVMPLAKKKMVAVPMKAGEAVVFYHATLHGSVPNLSNSKRLNIVQGIYDKGAQLQHFFLDRGNGGKITQYNITIDDFYKLENLQKPGYLTAEREVEFDFPQLSERDFLKLYPSPGIVQKIKSFFNGR